MIRKAKCLFLIFQRINVLLLFTLLVSGTVVFSSYATASVHTAVQSLHRTVLWQHPVDDGALQLFLLPPKDPTGSPFILAYALRGLYCYDAYNGSLRWYVAPPPSNDSRFHGCVLDDINTDGSLELIVGFESWYVNPSDSRDADGLAGFSIYDPYTGALQKRVYCTNSTDDLAVGTFWFGKGLVYNGAYVEKVILPEMPEKIFYDSYGFLCVFDVRDYSVVYNASLFNETDPTTGTIYRPFIHDLNGDGFDEIIMSMDNISLSYTFSGIVRVLNGKDFSMLWDTPVPLNNRNHDACFCAEDCEYLDYNNDNITDILLTDASDGIVLLDGATGEVVWANFDYGHGDSVLNDIDGDGKVEVITSLLEHVAIIDAQTGRVEYATTLDFYFDCGNISVVDLYGNNTNYIFATSFYHDTLLFTPHFELVESLPNIPHGWVYTYLFYDLNHDGILEFFGGCFDGSNAVFAYVFDGTFTLYSTSSSPFSFSSFLLTLVLCSFFFSLSLRRLRLQH